MMGYKVVPRVLVVHLTSDLFTSTYPFYLPYLSTIGSPNIYLRDTGATLEEPIADGAAPKMTGSAMLVGAKTREEVLERLKRDVYVKGEVWDLEKVQIIPFKSAVRKAL
jgi:hypothetical protein